LLKNIGPNGCPPKAVTDWEDIKKKGNEADAALDKAAADLKSLDEKGKAKLDDIMQRYAKAKITSILSGPLWAGSQGSQPRILTT
jgi:hypothetical protein